MGQCVLGGVQTVHGQTGATSRGSVGRSVPAAAGGTPVAAVTPAESTAPRAPVPALEKSAAPPPYLASEESRLGTAQGTDVS